MLNFYPFLTEGKIQEMPVKKFELYFNRMKKIQARRDLRALEIVTNKTLKDPGKLRKKLIKDSGFTCFEETEKYHESQRKAFAAMYGKTIPEKK